MENLAPSFEDTKKVIEALHEAGLGSEVILASVICPNISDDRLRKFVLDVLDHVHTVKHSQPMVVG